MSNKQKKGRKEDEKKRRDDKYVVKPKNAVLNLLLEHNIYDILYIYTHIHTYI